MQRIDFFFGRTCGAIKRRRNAGIGLLVAVGVAGTGAAELDDWEYVEPSSPFRFEVERFEANPIVHREMTGLIGDTGGLDRGNNINGPSLIKVPD